MQCIRFHSVGFSFLVYLLFIFYLPAASQVRLPYSKLVGKYQFDGGMIIQFSEKKGKLFLITPGAPLQEMEILRGKEFRSKTLKEDTFQFVENNNAITLTSSNAQNKMQARKISATVEDYTEAMDSVLQLKKRSKHFEFSFSRKDVHSIDSMAVFLENKYNKILADFKLKNLPLTRVKIYPDLKSFHLAINSPDAPPQVLATAFGKNEFRMASPSEWGEEGGTMLQNITHEFTHCVHLNIDYSPNNPRWLWEGVAMYEAEWFLNPNEIETIRKKNFPQLQELGNGMEYMLGYVVIEAIKDRWGFDTVINLIKNKGNVQSVLGITQQEFEEIVFNSVYKKYIK